MVNKVTKEDIFEMCETQNIRRYAFEANKPYHHRLFNIGDIVTVTILKQFALHDKPEVYEGKLVNKDKNGITLQTINGLFEKTFDNYRPSKDTIYISKESILTIRGMRK